MNKITKMPANECSCGYKTDVDSLIPTNKNRVVVSRPKPRNGDMTVCARCARIWVFTDRGTMKREPSDKDFEKLKEESPENFTALMHMKDAILKGFAKIDDKADPVKGVDRDLDHVYIRGKIAGKWGSYSIRELFLAGEGHQVFDWALDKIDGLQGVRLTLKGLKMFVQLYEELGSRS